MNSHGSLQIRRLTVDDLDFADELRAIVGWNQTRGDWRRFLEHEPNGCFLGTWEGRPAGTVTTITYGQDLAWIGMMLVHPDFRRRGIATALMDRAVEYLRGRNTRCIKLDATPAGQPVYESLGFKTEWEIYRWERAGGRADVPVGGPTATFDPGDVDSDVFGVDRSAWVRRIVPVSRVVARRSPDGPLSGFGMIRTGARAAYIGPLVARDVDVGRSIAAETLSEYEGRPGGPGRLLAQGSRRSVRAHIRAYGSSCHGFAARA